MGPAGSCGLLLLCLSSGPTVCRPGPSSLCCGPCTTCFLFFSVTLSVGSKPVVHTHPPRSFLTHAGNHNCLINQKGPWACRWEEGSPRETLALQHCPNCCLGRTGWKIDSILFNIANEAPLSPSADKETINTFQVVSGDVRDRAQAGWRTSGRSTSGTLGELGCERSDRRLDRRARCIVGKMEQKAALGPSVLLEVAGLRARCAQHLATGGPLVLNGLERRMLGQALWNCIILVRALLL